MCGVGIGNTRGQSLIQIMVALLLTMILAMGLFITMKSGAGARELATNGEVRAGFKERHLNFNQGALSNPSPGMTQSSTSTNAARFTSLSFEKTSIQDAIAAIEEE